MEVKRNRVARDVAVWPAPRAWLTHRHLPAVLAALAVLLALPSLKVGWFADDHWHRTVLLRPATLPDLDLITPNSPLDLFSFLDGDPERTRRARDIGLLPWWTYEGVQAAFWRPLTSATHWLDYQLWPSRPAAMHTHSLLWFAAVVGAVALLYRRLMGVTVAAGLAALLFAIDDAHGPPVGFLSNRNALLAALFGVLAVIAHDRWRRSAWRPGAAAGPVLLAAGLLSAEAGIATVAYLVAYTMFLDPSSRRRRAAALLPYVAVVLVWRLVWTHLGYGFSPGADFYVDPAVEPLRFIAAAFRRAPILLFGQWAGVPSEITIILGPGQFRLLWLGAVAFLGLAALLIVPPLRNDRVARFWAAGMMLSLLPVCATVPMDRLLVFVGLGAFGLLAQFLHTAFAGPQASAPRRWRVPRAVLGVVFVMIHCLVAPVALLWRAANPMGPRSLMAQYHVRTPMDRSVERQSVVIASVPVAMIAGYLQILRALDGRPVPCHVRTLAPSGSTVELRRPDQRTLVLRPEKGYLRWPYDEAFRSKNHPFALGDRVELTGLTIEITELTADGRPAEATFHFAVPLEDPSLRWLRWDPAARTFTSFTPPPTGETVRL